MPTVRKRPEPVKLRWVVDYREFGRRRRAGFETKKEADAFKKDISLKLTRQVAGLPDKPVPKAQHVTFAEYAAQFLEGPALDLAVGTQVLYAARLKNHLTPAFGRLPLGSIDRARIERYKAKRRRQTSYADRPPAPALINRELALLKLLLRRAYQDEIVAGVPRMRMLTEVPRRPRRSLTDAEVEKLLANCDDVVRPLAFTAVMTGIRSGALIALEWPDVDLQRKVIHVHGGKGGKSRTVPILAPLLPVLRRLKKDGAGASLRVFGRLSFPKRHWLAAVKASGLDVLFHELRHTFVTSALRAGLDVRTVRDLAGHASIVTTERYTHPEAHRARQAMENHGLKWSQTMRPKPKQKGQVVKFPTS